MNKYLIIFSPYEENPLWCCCSLCVPLVEQSRQLHGLSYGQKPKCMIFPAIICNFRAEVHQKIQSKSVTIFQINEVSKLHPLVIHVHTYTHTHTNIGHYVQILFFYRKELLKGFFNMVSFDKEKDDKIQGYLFLCMRIIPGGFPGRPECQKLRSCNRLHSHYILQINLFYKQLSLQFSGCQSTWYTRFSQSKTE